MFLRQVLLYVFLAVHVGAPKETMQELELKATCRNYNSLEDAEKCITLAVKINT
jgi:hypothetical protein